MSKQVNRNLGRAFVAAVVAMSASHAMAATCAAAWNSATAYSAGNTASYASVNYVANWWTQGNNPSTNSGGSGSGQPWTSQGSCGSATPTPAPTPTKTPTPAPTPAKTPTPTPTPAPTPAKTPTPAPASGITSGATYKLINPASGLALDVPACGTASATGLQIWTASGTCEGGAGQTWKVTQNSDATYTLVNPESGGALDVPGCTSTNGTQLQIWPAGVGVCNSGGGQKWSITSNGDGSYTLVNPESGGALDVAGCGNTNGTKVDLWAKGVGVCNSGAGQKWQLTPFTPAIDGYTLVWQDNFAADSAIDTSKWVLETNDSGEGNNELEYYTTRSQNIFLQNGNLVIQALKENYTGADGQTRSYTSGRMHTSANWAYGRFEVSAKQPAGQGIWPAFWLLPQNSVYGTWAASGEIDIMESINLGAAGGNNQYGSLHYGGTWPNDLTSSQEYTPSANMTTGFHVYAVEWDPGQIRFYFDGVLYETQTNWSSTGGAYPAPFNQPFYIILNVAVGGTWPGSPDGTTPFPAQLQVQYVRVYQK